MYRIGVDIGGIFTDFALFGSAAAPLAIHKQLTTPREPAAAVLEGIATLLADNRAPIVVHGTTLVTNAVIERKGAATGMLVTAGFHDILDMGYESRYDLYDLRLKFPSPVVPRRMRAEVTERVRHDGTVERRLDRESVRKAVAALARKEGIEAIAVCLQRPAGVRIPVIDIIEIGAGGGSLAGVEDRGVLRVGPKRPGGGSWQRTGTALCRRRRQRKNAARRSPGKVSRRCRSSRRERENFTNAVV
jgi:N-methylhydantoinase A/oxoprolinase/acetone carboxylase beta subunit